MKKILGNIIFIVLSFFWICSIFISYPSYPEENKIKVIFWFILVIYSAYGFLNVGGYLFEK